MYMNSVDTLTLCSFLQRVTVERVSTNDPPLPLAPKVMAVYHTL